MKTIPSQHMQAKITPEHLRWAQSVDSALNGGVDMGTPTGVDATGVYNKFNQGNSSGVLIRIGATSSSEPVKWPASGPLTIHHGLGRQPIGFKIVDKDAAVDVYRTAVPTATTLQVASTLASANVTLYIF